MNDKPFIHMLKSRYGYYFFDVNMNEVVSISEETYNYLLNLMSNKIDNRLYTTMVKEEEKKLLSKGYLKSKRPSILEMTDIDNIEYYLTHRLSSILLQVTQKCNFRCRYCPYASGNLGYHTHNSLSMDWETAKKSIDFLALRTRDTKRINIGFYGGEPLIEYELICKCIEYSNDVFEGKILSYSLTTNAGLLNVEYTKYLIDNNVSIFVSLDGPQEIQDKNRKHAKDGSGTFAEVYENLNRIKTELPNYYNKIRINSVMDSADDCSKINDFFSSEIFNDSYISVNLQTPTDKKKLYYSDAFLKNRTKDNLLFLLHKANVYNKEQMTPIAWNYYKDFLSFEEQFVSFGEIPDKTWRSGPCMPGVKKPFVTVNGKIMICEKASDDSEALQIGSLREGFDIHKIKNICNEMKREKCKNCWNIYNCNICQIKIDDGEKLSGELFDVECKVSCLRTEYNLKNFIALSEVKFMDNT